MLRPALQKRYLTVLVAWVDFGPIGSAMERGHISRTPSQLGILLVIIASTLAFAQINADSIKDTGNFNSPIGSQPATAGRIPDHELPSVTLPDMTLSSSGEPAGKAGDLAISSGTMTPSASAAIRRTYTAIPETSAVLIGGLGMLGLLRRLRP